MKLSELTDKKILILGYGKEGKATEAYLRTMASPVDITVADQKTDPDYLSKQEGYDLIVKTPGINKKYVKHPYTTATNIFFANCNNTVIGVTGTKGKSTTASLIHHILVELGRKSRLVGNIGNPALSALMEPVGKDDIFVMELSSYMLDDIQFTPRISLILNLFPEHMNYHGTVENYYEAKKRIVAHAVRDDYFVYSGRYPELQSLAESLDCRTVPYDDIRLPDGDLLLKGEHNKNNARAALAVCQLLGIENARAFRAVQTFKPLQHRLEYVGTFAGIEFYDDAISTTPESAMAAVQTIDSVGTLFLGGLNRGYNYETLTKLVMEKKIANIVLFPDAGKEIGRLFESYSGWKPRLLETESMEEAVVFAYKYTPPGQVCLLSTAAPSYSLWKSFEEKGDLFKHFVRLYAEKQRAK